MVTRPHCKGKDIFIGQEGLGNLRYAIEHDGKHDFEFCPLEWGRRECWCEILHTPLSPEQRQWRQENVG